MKILLLILLLVSFGYGQKCEHNTDTHERFLRVRLLPPVTITNITLTTVSTVHQDKFGIYANTLYQGKDSVLPPKFDLDSAKGKKFWALYCVCGHLYVLSELAPNQR